MGWYAFGRHGDMNRVGELGKDIPEFKAKATGALEKHGDLAEAVKCLKGSICDYGKNEEVSARMRVRGTKFCSEGSD